MPHALSFEFDAESDLLFIHFDVSKHHIKLDTFVATAQSAKRIVETINSQFFDGNLQYELIVLPAQGGSFLSKLAMSVVGGVSAVYTFLNTDVGEAYVKELTGKPPVEWAEQLGERHRSFVEEVLEDEKSESPKLTDDAGEGVTQKEIQCVAQIVVSMTRGVLELDNTELQQLGMEIGELTDTIDARADFYEACINDPDVARIGFTPEDDFPIPRSAFPERAQRLPRKEKEKDEPAWVVTIETIYVTSPNWDEKDQTSRQWKGKDAIRRDCYFVIEDSEFWSLVKNKELQVEVLDELKVQWAHQEVAGKAKNRKVLRVLEYNGQKFADPLSESALGSIIGKYSEGFAPSGEPSLFDYSD